MGVAVNVPYWVTIRDGARVEGPVFPTGAPVDDLLGDEV